MAETAGESFVFIILFVIFIFVIVLVFAYFLLFGFGFTNSSSCYVSSQVSNFFYNGLCITQFFCIAETLQHLGLTPPLLGCSPSVQTYTSSSTSGQAFAGVTEGLGTCWYQYGGEQGLSVLPGYGLDNAGSPPNGSGLCSVIHLDLNQNVTFYNLTQYLKSVAFSTKVSCLNHTVEQSCSNPLSASNPNGFYCNTNSPNECIASSSDYFTCKNQQDYSSTYQGYTLQNIFLNSSKTATTAANNMSSYLCQAAAGCSFSNAVAECVNTTGQVGSCQQTYNDFCQPYPNGNINCSVNYDPNLNSYVPPPACTLTEAVNPTSTVNVSYFDYLSPGVNLLYSYKNKTTGGSAEPVKPYSNKSINNAQLYIVFLNSFAGTSYPPQLVNTPSECYPALYLNNYPNNAIEYSCTRALATYGAAGIKASYGRMGLIVGTGVYAGAFAGGYLYGQCSSNSVCNQYVDTNIENAVSTGLLVTSGLSDCVQALGTGMLDLQTQINNGILSLFGISSGQSGLNFLGRNQMYLCAVTS